MSSSTGGSYPHEPPFFAPLAFSDLACNHRNRSYYGKKESRQRISKPIPVFHCFDNTRTLRYKFGNRVNNHEINIGLTFYRSRKGGKNESQKLGVPRLLSYYLRRLFSPFVR